MLNDLESAVTKLEDRIVSHPSSSPLYSPFSPLLSSPTSLSSLFYLRPLLKQLSDILVGKHNDPLSDQNDYIESVLAEVHETLQHLIVLRRSSMNEARNSSE